MANKFAGGGVETKRWGEDSRYKYKNSTSRSGAEASSGGIRNRYRREGK